MHTTFEIKDPKKLDATFTVTATVGEFMEMLAQIEEDSKNVRGHANLAYPLCRLKSGIESVIGDAKKHFYRHVNVPGAE